MGRKTTVWIFQPTNCQDYTWENLNITKNGHLKRETQCLLITAQNNALMTNYFKAKIHNKQQDNKCRLYVNKAKTIRHIICESSKLAQKERKTKYDWVGKVTHWELCKKKKKMKFDPNVPNGILINQNLSWRMRRIKFYEIQTDRLIPPRKSDLEINKKSEHAV